MKAKGFVSEVRRLINVKDSFTRMKQEREQERRVHRSKVEAKVQEANRRRRERSEIKNRLFSLFGETDPHVRGRALEGVLNDLFANFGLGVRESFSRVENPDDGVLEQVDGVIELDGEIYLVEMKWLAKAVGVGDVSRHLVRVFNRGSSRGLFVSATEFSPAALDTCKEALTRTVVALCLLQEIVELLETDGDLGEMLRKKVRAAMLDKAPFVRMRPRIRA